MLTGNPKAQVANVIDNMKLIRKGLKMLPDPLSWFRKNFDKSGQKIVTIASSSLSEDVIRSLGANSLLQLKERVNSEDHRRKLLLAAEAKVNKSVGNDAKLTKKLEQYDALCALLKEARDGELEAETRVSQAVNDRILNQNNIKAITKEISQLLEG